MLNEFPQFGTLEHASLINDRIVGLASLLKKQCGVVNKLPFDAEGLTEKLGLKISLVDFPSEISGRLRLDTIPPTIELNRSNSRQRLRFTICHEIAHLCFSDLKPALPFERGSPDQVANVQRREEQLCDMLAAELLMPKTSFLRIAKQQNATLKGLRFLANAFDVSVGAALSRVRKLAAWSVGMTSWKISQSGNLLPHKRYITVRRNIRDKHAKAQISSDVCRTLENVERLLIVRPQLAQQILQDSQRRYLPYKFNGIKVYFAVRSRPLLNAFVLTNGF